MHYLDILTILCTGLLIGNELAVLLFINPVIWKLDRQPQAQVTSLFARSLGKAMPFWYALSLVFLLVEAVLRHRESRFLWFLAAAVLWTATIAYTIAALVPINNRLAKLQPGAVSHTSLKEHRKWDTLHRFRVAALVVAMVCCLYGILGSH